MNTQTFQVKGMHCASCQYLIANKIGKLAGVTACDVNFATEKATISYDPTAVTVEKMNKEINDFGYTLVAPSEHSGGNNHHDHQTMNHHGHEGMDHSQHLGLNQTKKEKLKELRDEKHKMQFVLPIALTVFSAMMWDIAARTLPMVPTFPIPMGLFNTISLILATPIMFWIGKPFIDGVIVFIRHRTATMDTLIGIGTLTAYIYSTIILLFPPVRTLLNAPEYIYLDVVIVVIGFVKLGKYLEVRSKMRTGEAIEKLLGLQAKTALIMRDGKESEVPIDQVHVGDVVIVKPGAKIAVDGIIVHGSSSVNESMISGEPIPVDKKEGDRVIGSTINKQGYFQFKATGVGADTMLAQIIKMVEEAQGSRAPIQGLADRVSAVFVPVVLGIAIATFVLWLTVGGYFLGIQTAVSFGLICFVGILVIACPCALGLATPTAIIVGVGKGAQHGILIKNAAALEKLKDIDTVVLDKTGTITQGTPTVTDIVVFDSRYTDDSLLKNAASIEKQSDHPLAQAIVAKAHEKNILLSSVQKFKTTEGVGVEGTIEGKHIVIRRPHGIEGRSEIESLQSEGKTVTVVEVDHTTIGLLAISDTVKEYAKSTVDSLHRMRISVVMLTGDNKKAANYIGGQVGVDTVIAEVLPQDKAQVIKELQQQGKKIAMAGDGINDAPALTQADVGIAMATGTDVAIESADVVLLHGDIQKIAQAIRLSKTTVRIIKQNLFWAFIYNIIGIPLAAGVLYPFTGLLLNPIFAGMAMAGSSVSVVLNSLRLRSARL